MKIVFMGTPDFAVGALDKLVKSGHEICLVVTQPDRPKGRGKDLAFSPVKECALKHGIPVFQPLKIREKESVEKLREFDAEVFVVAAFGQILTKEVLEMPKYGGLCIHASLLPKYRGAAPIQWAIMDGETETGITIMQMDEGIDTGDMLCKKTVPIEAYDTASSLHDKLSIVGADLIISALEELEAGNLSGEPQGDSPTAYAKMINKKMGEIDWNHPAKRIERLVRAMNSWPSAYTTFQGKKLKIWECSVTEESAVQAPGTICKIEKDRFFVCTGEGQLEISSVQLEGKKRMSVESFLLGNRMECGIILV